MRWKLLFAGLVTSILSNGVHAADISSVDADGVVTIRPGEAFEIVFPDRNDLSHPKFSRVLDHLDTSNVKGYHKPDPNAPPPTGPALLSFELRQTSSGVMLNLRNDTGVPLKYSADIVIETGAGTKSMHTSMCPIFPDMMGIENWPQPIVMLKLSGFHKADAGQFTCD